MKIQLDEQSERRFWSKVSLPITEDGCMPWMGGRSGSKYGTYNIPHPLIEEAGQKNINAHRMAYMLTEGDIPDGLELDHTCANIICCRPSHLEPVTRQENVSRMASAMRREFCKNGHEYTEENTYEYKRPGGRITRNCRTCDRIKARARRSR